jgi:hypothetical protein
VIGDPGRREALLNDRIGDHAAIDIVPSAREVYRLLRRDPCDLARTASGTKSNECEKEREPPREKGMFHHLTMLHGNER